MLPVAPGQFPTAQPGLSGASHGKFETDQLQSVGRVRTEFPETWLWNSATVGYVTIHLKIFNYRQQWA